MPQQTILTKKKSTNEKAKSIDAELAEHISKAEHHLIEAVLLFEKDGTVRTRAFQDRLTRAQEIVTSLNSEELIRARDATTKRKRK